MKTLPYVNWLHLDFKGMMPSQHRLCRWLEWFAQAGFTGVVLEYEDRLPWQTWPGTYRPGLDVAAWRNIWEVCRTLKLEVIPLIQTYGHLEWLLKHDSWAHLRCAGHQNLLNPANPHVQAKLSEWIDEVLRLHPDVRYMHVGLDEVYNMGAHRPGCSRREAMEEYTAHVTFVCQRIIRAGRLPIIWGDMFLNESHTWLLAKLPPEVIACDWKYNPTFKPDTATFAGGGRRVMAASAVRKSPAHLLIEDINARFQNIRAWHDTITLGQAGPVDTLIHTVWARGRSLSPMYGPWEGWLPSFQLAGQPGTELSHPMRAGLALLNKGMQTHVHAVAEQASLDIREVHSANDWEEQALRWWELTLRHYTLIMVVHYRSIGYQSILSAMKHQGHDPLLAAESDHGRRMLLNDLNTLSSDMAQWLKRNEWSDTQEFLDSRLGNLAHVAGLPAFLAV